MKSLYGVAFCLLLTGSAYAQQVTLDQKLGPQATVLTEFQNVKPLGTVLDTVFTYRNRATDSAFFTAQDPAFNNPLPVFGTNSRFFHVGAKYSFSGSANIVGVLVSAAVAAVNGPADTLQFNFFEIEGSSVSKVGITPFVTTNQLVANGIDPKLGTTAIALPEGIPVTKDFIVYIQTLPFSLGQTGNPIDVIGLWSNAHGDGKGENNAMFLTYNNQQQAILGTVGSIFNVNGEPIDADPYIFPILEFEEGAGVASYPTLSGLTLKGAYPSTATSQTAVRFELDKPSAVNIDLLDLNGRIVKSYAAQQFGTGSHEMSLDLTGLPSGSYLYKVTTDRTQVASKLTIVR